MHKKGQARTNIVLVGFMGTGKSTVGRIVAERTGRNFIDVDQIVEQEAGMTISAIFASEQESGFRKREQAAVNRATAEGGQVIACGGGVITVPANVRALRASGLVVYLSATPEIIFERIKNEVSGRPLISSGDPFRVINKLIRDREELYKSAAHHTIDTSDLDPDQVAEAVIGASSEGPGAIGKAGEGRQISVELPQALPDAYKIIIRRGLLDRLGAVISEIGPRKIFIVSSEDIFRLYGDQVETSLHRACLPFEVLLVPAGEESKGFSQVKSVHERLIQRGAERGDLIVALGGGVIGDLAGFVAATYQRGVRYVQVPTTLLAQVDSSIGGKTGINVGGLKNMVGAFHQPAAVLADPDTLVSLPKQELLCGIAEIIKAGYLGGGQLLEHLESSMERLVEPDLPLLTEVIAQACAFKAHVVEMDEREGDQRRILNYGHTFAHAIEAREHYFHDIGAGTDDWKHGHAVAVGMVFAARLGVSLGIVTPDVAKAQQKLIQRAGLPVSVPEEYLSEPGELLGAMRSDKKTKGGKINFVFVQAPGKPVVRSVEEDVILAELEAMAAEATAEAGT